MQKIRAPVVGLRYLGRFHAPKYSQAADCELVAVADSRPEAREPLAAELKTRAVSDYRALLGGVDAVSVATPTPGHFAIARDFLEAGAHVLVEKPITDTPAQARELIALAARVSLKTERKMRIFADDAYLSLDLQQKILTLIRKRAPADAPGALPVTIEEQSLEPGDALRAEIDSFLGCIRSGRAPVVPGEAGLMALETAMRITEQVNRSLAEHRARTQRPDRIA